MTEFIGELLGHQKEGHEFGLKVPYHINGFEPGLGKTATSLSIAVKVPGKILAVVPAYLRDNWHNEIKKFTRGLDIDVVSYGQLSKVLKSGIKYNMVIADEVHYAKNPRAQRSKNLHEVLLTSRPSHFMGLSGTPIKNRVSEFWSLLQMCYYGGRYNVFKRFYKLYYKFCNHFSYERTFEANGVPIVRFDGLRPHRIPELKHLIAPIYIRRKAKDVLDLPPTNDINIRLKDKKYDDKLKEAFELFETNHKDPAYMSLKAANALAKISTTVNVASDLIEQGEKVVIFSCHQEAVRQIAEKFKVKFIDGSIPTDSRQAIVDAFNDDEKVKVLPVTIGSGSTGYNYVSACHMIINDFPFVPGDLEQARKRIDRIGQTRPCFYHNIFTSEFDESLYEMILRKAKDISKVYE